MLSFVECYEYYMCTNCGHGNRWEWYKPKGSFYNGNFIHKVCPKCGIVDDTKGIGSKDSKKEPSILIKGVDY